MVEFRGKSSSSSYWLLSFCDLVSSSPYLMSSLSDLVSSSRDRVLSFSVRSTVQLSLASFQILASEVSNFG